MPYINGAGEATVVTTDAQGRQVVTSLPFYVSNTLLARGLSDFDLSVGRLRDDYGLRNFSYADNAASGIYRYGVSDRLTLSTHAEAASDLRLLGIGGDIAVATFGTLSLAASGSDGQGDSGQQYLLGYSYYSRRLGLSLQHIERSAGYGDLGTLDGEYQLSRRTDQATASLTFDEHGTIGTGYFDIRARDGSRTRLANLSYSRPIGSRSSVYLALNKDLDGDGYSALMQLVIPFDINGLLNIGVTRDSDRRYSERVIWSRSTPSQGGLGWNLGYGGGASRYQQADLTWRMQNVQLQGGLYGETGNYTRWADLSGSLVWMDNAVFASNRINDAFVLVSTKGYPQVPIRYENQLMGSTDDNGHLLVPWVAAYYPAKFQIEPLDLPANVSAPEVEQRVAVRQAAACCWISRSVPWSPPASAWWTSAANAAAGQPGRRNRQRPARQRRLGRPGLFRRIAKRQPATRGPPRRPGLPGTLPPGHAQTHRQPGRPADLLGPHRRYAMSRHSTSACLLGFATLCASPLLLAACTTSSGTGNFGSLSSFTVASTAQTITGTTGFKCTGSLLSILSTNTIDATIASTANPLGTTPRLYNAASGTYLPYSICRTTAAAPSTTSARRYAGAAPPSSASSACSTPPTAACRCTCAPPPGDPAGRHLYRYHRPELGLAPVRGGHRPSLRIRRRHRQQQRQRYPDGAQDCFIDSARTSASAAPRWSRPSPR